MQKRITLIVALGFAAISTAGCVPVAVGAAGAVAVDTISEDRGRDLF